MPDREHPITEAVRLEVDDEVEYLLDALAHDIERENDPSVAPDSNSHAIVAGLLGEPLRGLFGMGRAAKRLRESLDALAAEWRMITSEYDGRFNSIRAQLMFLDNVIAEHARAERERTHGAVKSLDILGVGRWQTTEHKAELRVTDDAALIAWLGVEGREALRARYVEQRPHLLGREVKAALPAIVAEHGGEIPPGVEMTETTVTVSSPVVRR